MRNRFGGKCGACGRWVAAEAGVLVGKSPSGKWVVGCDSACGVEMVESGAVESAVGAAPAPRSFAQKRVDWALAKEAAKIQARAACAGSGLAAWEREYRGEEIDGDYGNWAEARLAAREMSRDTEIALLSME